MGAGEAGKVSQETLRTDLFPVGVFVLIQGVPGMSLLPFGGQAQRLLGSWEVKELGEAPEAFCSQSLGRPSFEHLWVFIRTALF